MKFSSSLFMLLSHYPIASYSGALVYPHARKTEIDTKSFADVVKTVGDDEYWSVCGTPQSGSSLNELSGSSVSICADGSYMITGSHTGAVLYTYDNDIFDWVVAYDFSDDLLPNRQFYHYVTEISDDCSKVVIGAPGNDQKGYDAGSVQIFSKDDSTTESWEQLQALFGDRLEEIFGYAVDISEGGKYVIIGAPGADYVEVYELLSHVMTYDLKNTLGGSNGDLFGHSVAISGSGERAIIGAPLGGQLNSNGFVRIVNLIDLSFVKTIPGNTAGAQIGEAVDFSQDGSTVAFSSIVNGHVIVFRFDDIAQDWLKVGVSICVEDEAFGSDISLSGDGQAVAIGAPLNNHYGPQSGKGYVYENQDEWTLVGLEKFGTVAFDSCGTTVALSSNKERWVMGCPESDHEGKDKGKATVFCSENPAFATNSPSIAPSSKPTKSPIDPSPTRNPTKSPTKAPSPNNDFGGQDTSDPISGEETSSLNNLLQLILGLIGVLVSFLLGTCVGGVSLFSIGCGSCATCGYYIFGDCLYYFFSYYCCDWAYYWFYSDPTVIPTGAAIEFEAVGDVVVDVVETTNGTSNA